MKNGHRYKWIWLVLMLGTGCGGRNGSETVSGTDSDMGSNGDADADVDTDTEEDASADSDTEVVGEDIRYPSADQFRLVWRDDFETFDSARWARAAHSFAENEANFVHGNVVVEDGHLHLTVDIAQGGGKPYTGGEIRTHAFFTYGRFETRARFAAGSGIISSIFTFYDHYADPDMPENWNEIDIEFLGKDTHSIQYNEIVWNEASQRVMNEFHDSLDFNPSQEFRVYAFEWTPSGTSFYIDGELRHQSDRYADLMFRPQRLMMNIWPTNLSDWAGPIDDAALPTVAVYDWVQYWEYLGEDEVP